jgi:putative FmdB family regulatory protein
MPVYEHQCLKCKHLFDLHRPVEKYDEPADCPECGHEAKRLISALAVHGDEASWIWSTNETLTSPGEQPVTTRSEYNARLKAKGYVPVG